MEHNLTEHQYEVYRTIVDDISKNLFSFTKSDRIEDRLLSLMGAAGVGKSYVTTQITKEVIKRLGEFDYYNNEKICITAPTHKAVKVLKEMLFNHNIKADCRTLQSFLNIKPIPNYETGEEKFLAIKNHKLIKASLLIVDESSMVSKQLYDFIIDAIRVGRVNTVLFISDPFQLLPVNSSETEVFKLKKQYRLTQIVRQAEDSNIIKLATMIRKCIEEKSFEGLDKLSEGKYGEDIAFFKDKELFLKDYFSNEEWYKENRIMASYTNAQVDTFNTIIRKQYWKEKGVSNPDNYLPTDIVRFKNSLSVNKVFRPNSTLYYNGEEVMIDKVEFVTDEKTGLNFWKCTVLGRSEIDFFRVLDFENLLLLDRILENYAHLAKSSKEPYNKEYWKDYFQLKNAFAEVQYIYASTIHKLQGSTYDTAYIDLASLISCNNISNDLRYRLAYVAITRARKSVKILY